MPACPQSLLRAVRTARPVLLALLLAVVLTPLASLLSPGRALAADPGPVVLSEAARHRGTPYVYGAGGPSSFDCSGFTSYVYGRLGISLPHSSSGQYADIPHVSKSDKVPGDLIFTYNSGGIYHVGIYAGGNQMWAAPKTGDVVRKQTIWTSAYVVGRPVAERTRRHWVALGGRRGLLGDARTGERAAAVRGARYSTYDNGQIFYSADSGTHELHGSIRSRWIALGRESGPLGLPVTDERVTPNGKGHYSKFQGGSVYASRATGAHEVRGAIRRTWAAAGYERSKLGFPTSDERRTSDGKGRYSTFEHGKITWNARTGDTTVKYS